MNKLLLALLLIPSMLLGVTVTHPSGEVNVYNSGSTITINGALGGTPSGGTINLTNVSLTSVARTTGSYADPAWITTLDWTKLISTPTTLAGYGITNGVANTVTVNGHPLSSNVTVTAGDVGLGLVENTALSTWAGTANITTLGTVGTGTWNATAITNAKIATALSGKTYEGLTITTTTGTLTIANGKTIIASNSLTLAGTDGTVMTFPAASGSVLTADSTATVTNKTFSFGSNTFSATSAQVATAVSDEIGSSGGPLVFRGALPKSLFLFPTFSNGEDKLRLAFSIDGKTIQQVANKPLSTTACRDPRLIYLNGTYYSIFTTGAIGATTVWAIESSTDLITWTAVATPSVAAVGSVTHTWGPCPLMDETGAVVTTDGYVHVLTAVSLDGAATQQIYEQHASTADLTTWSAPALVSGSWSTGNYVTADHWMVYGGTYYLINSRNVSSVYREVQTSCATMLGTYANTDSTNAFAGLTACEGASLVHDGSRWHAHSDNFQNNVAYGGGGGLLYSLSSVGTAFTGWSTPVKITGSSAYRGHRLSNAGCWYVTDPKVIADVLAAYAVNGAANNIAYHNGLGIGDIDSYFHTGTSNSNAATPGAPLSIIAPQGNIGGQVYIASGADGGYATIIFGIGAATLQMGKRFSIDLSNDASPNAYMQSYDFQNSKLCWKSAAGYFYSGAESFVVSTAGKGVRYGSTTGPLDTYGSGSPESVVSAPVGSTYRRTDGGANTTFYVKESGSGNTGWVAK